MQEEKKKILFYSATTPTVLIYRIGKLLRKNNYETILLTMCHKEQFDWSFYSQAFDKIICSNFQFFKPKIKKLPYLISKSPGFFKFLMRMKTINPHVVIGVAGNNWQLKLAHKYFFKKYPFVYFPYDILSHFFSSREEALKSEIAPRIAEIEAEKYLFENSDGIMHKGAPDELEPINGRLHEKIEFCPLQLSFFPYCSKEDVIHLNKNKLSKKDKEIHIVYSGFLANNQESKRIFNGYFQDIVNQRIHMHVYPIVSHISKDEEKKYIDDFFGSLLKNKYFHSDKISNIKELNSELSKYDFALWLSYETNKSNIEQKYATGNKISTYFEAGLPIIYNKNTIFLGKLLSYYGVGIKFTNSDIKELGKRLKKINYKEMEEKVEKARKDFDMDNNFPRLKKFIEEVIPKKQS